MRIENLSPKFQQGRKKLDNIYSFQNEEPENHIIEEGSTTIPEPVVETEDAPELFSGSPKIVDFDISGLTVESIVDVTSLEPCIVYAKYEGIDDPIGVPGFFDQSNAFFIDFHGKPITSPGFDKALNQYILTKIEAENNAKD